MAYDKNYWDYQKKIGQNFFHTHAVSNKFKSFVNPEDAVLDFGCGGGFVLNTLNCKKRVGIEINPHAQKQLKSFGIQVNDSFRDLKSEEFDIVLSNSALEHVDNPLDVLAQAHRVLKKGGKLMFSVPHEDLSYSFHKNDINQHLFTWSPMSIGNLIQKAGFEIKQVKVTKYIQPPFASIIYKILGLQGYKFFGRIYRFLRKCITPIKKMGVSGDIIVFANKK